MCGVNERVRVLDLRQMTEPFLTNAELLTIKCCIATKEKMSPLDTPEEKLLVKRERISVGLCPARNAAPEMWRAAARE